MSDYSFADWFDLGWSSPFGGGGGGGGGGWPYPFPPIVVQVPIDIPAATDPQIYDDISNLKTAADALSQLARKIIAGLKGVADFLWKQAIKSIFLKIWNALKTLSQWMERHLRPMIDFLKRLRKMYQLWYNRYVRPMLLMIQHVRQYLQILSLLHIKIAQKLDAYLANLQSKIVQSFATVIATINTAVDVLNALVDPTALIRKPALLLSIRRQLPALIHAITGRPPGYWFPSPRGSAGGPFKPVTSPFLPGDPAQNPKTSSYLSGDDGIGDISGSLVGFEFAAGAVDETEPLDYFNDDLYPVPT